MNTYLKFTFRVFALTVPMSLLLFSLYLLAFATGSLLTVPVKTADTTPLTFISSENLTFLPLIRADALLPTIHYFRADVEIADPGDTLQLEWSTSDAVTVTLYHLLPTGQLGEFWNVPLTGTMPYTISETSRNHTDFWLVASNISNQWIGASLSITLTCPDTWFFSPVPDICPAAPAIFSLGAEEHFEHGVMLWVQGQDMIYVLFDDDQFPKWSAYTDEWDEGEPESDPTIIPPPGYYQPVRGFGLVWREQPGVRDRLGWGIDEEGVYDTAVQYTSYPRYNDTYIRAQDGNVWRLEPEHSGWEKVIVDSGESKQ